MAEHIPHRITITGDPGSGKTTFARNVSARTGYELVTTGNVFRAIAKERGISVADVNAQAEIEKEIDAKVDDYLIGLNNDPRNLVLDSRMAWHFLEQSLKVRLTVDLDVAAERIFGDDERGDDAAENFSDMEMAIKEVERSRASEIKRYKTLYSVNIGDDSNFDLVINTSQMTQDEVMGAFDAAFEAYKKRLSEAA